MDLMSFVPDGLVKAGINALARHVATGLAAVVLTLLLSHGATQTDAKHISEDVGSIILALGSVAWSLYDNKKVDTKIKTAAATGSVQAANTPAIRTIVAQNGTPDALAQALAKLKAGQE